MPTRAGSASEPGRAAHEPGAPGSSAQRRLRLCTQQGLEREVHEAGAGQNFAKLLSIFLKQNVVFGRIGIEFDKNVRVLQHV